METTTHQDVVNLCTIAGILVLAVVAFIGGYITAKNKYKK